MDKQDDDRAVRLIAVHEVKHLQATLNRQMENMVEGDALSAALRLKVLRKLFLVDAALCVEIAKIEASDR